MLDFLRVPYAGLRPLDGISLRPLIEVSVTDRPAAIGFEYANMAVWLENQYKSVALLEGETPELAEAQRPAEAASGKSARFRPGKKTVELQLYDIKADPEERKNLAGGQPDRVKATSAALEGWRRSCRQSFESAED